MNSTHPLRVRRGLLIGGLLLAHALFDFFAFRYARLPELVSAAAVGVWFAQPALLGVWAALGPGSLLRIPRMMLLAGAGVGLLVSSQSPPANDRESLVFHMSAFGAALLLFGMLAVLRGWRLVPAEVQDRQAAAQWRQASLQEILLLVGLAGAVLAIWRNLPSPFPIGKRDWEGLAEPNLQTFLVFTFVQLIPMVGLATDCNQRHTGWWLLAVLNSVACTGLLLWRLPGPFDVPGAIMVAVSAASASALASFFVIRLAGYRLIRTPNLPNLATAPGTP